MKYTFFFISLLFLIFTSCKSAKTFEFKSVKSYKIEKMGLKGTTFNAQLEYYNPNNFRLVLKKIDCDIFVNDQIVTHYGLDSVIFIPPNQNFVVPASLPFEISTLLKYGVDIMFNKPLKISILGKAILSKGLFTKIVPIQYSTTKTINVKASIMKEAMNAIQKEIN
jgi:hypothetical protein